MCWLISQLLIVLMENNPYEANLQQDAYESKLKEIEAMMNAPVVEEATESPTDNAKIQQLHDYYSNAFHFTSLLSVPSLSIRFEL